jgi:hypothetical protein
MQVKRRGSWVAALAGMLMLTACYPLSLQPLFTEGDVTVDAALAGIWQKGGDEEQWVIEAPQGGAYKATHRVGDESESLVIRAGRLGPATLLEMRGEKNPDDSQAVPAYSFWRFRREGDQLEVMPLKPEYFEALIKAGKLNIAQVVRGELVVFTGTTAEVRAWLLPRLADREMYQDTERFRRVRVEQRDGMRGPGDGNR